MTTRSLLYILAKLLGDLSAIARGRIFKRAGWRLSGKVTSRLLGRICK